MAGNGGAGWPEAGVRAPRRSLSRRRRARAASAAQLIDCRAERKKPNLCSPGGDARSSSALSLGAERPRIKRTDSPVRTSSPASRLRTLPGGGFTNENVALTRLSTSIETVWKKEILFNAAVFTFVAIPIPSSRVATDAVAAASGAASVRVWHITSRGWDPWTKRPLPGLETPVHNHFVLE
jgi:hypothetical protein